MKEWKESSLCYELQMNETQKFNNHTNFNQIFNFLRLSIESLKWTGDAVIRFFCNSLEETNLEWEPEMRTLRWNGQENVPGTAEVGAARKSNYAWKWNSMMFGKSLHFAQKKTIKFLVQNTSAYQFRK